jgi:hypothetical protein
MALPLIYKKLSGTQPLSVAGIGDALITLKHRFLRLDSERGTTQASFTIGPKFATGGADRRNLNGEFLAVDMQPGTGTTDLFAKINLTYTGLFHLRRLVADPSFSYLRRFGSLRGTRKGDEAEARLWIHYRPLQTRLVGGEWFIGPALTWQHAAADRISGPRLPGTGSDVFSVGVTSYVSPWGGLVFWAGGCLSLWLWTGATPRRSSDGEFYLELPNSLFCSLRLHWRTEMNRPYWILTLALLLSPALNAQVERVEMRVEGMT